jgi:hypothetical protein
MKLTKGKVSTASLLGDHSSLLSILVHEQVVAKMGEEVSVIGFEGFDERRLRALHDYLVDRPSLMDERAVKDGVWALRTILNIPTPINEL